MVGIAYFAVISLILFDLPDASIAEKDTFNGVLKNLRGKNKLGLGDNLLNRVEYNKITNRIKKVGAPYTRKNVPVYYCK